MKRWYLVAAVAVGLWPVAEVRAQEGLAPTAPVVPAPVLKNGSVLAPSEGGWGSSPRLSVAKWSPFRNPATASTVEPTASVYAQPQSLSPQPAAVSGPDANCGPAGCARPARDRSCWSRVKALLGYHDSPTDIPTCRPTPYVTPLMGMFPCTGAAGCGSGCGSGYGYPYSTDPIRYGVPNDRQAPAYAPLPPSQPMPATPMQPMPQPVQPGTTPPGTTAGPVVMPSRGMQGSAVQPTWQGRVVPASAVAPKSAPATGPVVPTGFKYPVPGQK
jgi:hypothetical protein